MLENLVRNGVDAIEGSGVVKIETDVVDRFFVIRVKDTGRGIPPEIQARLFEPFFTTKADGTGMGLAICRSIIEAHDGRISGASSENGAVFEFVLKANA